MIVACHMLITATRVSNWRRATATSPFPFMFIWVGVLKSNKVTINLLKSFWSIASPNMLGMCKAGVSINPRQPDKKPR
jgi:hypothetical protein